MSKVGLQLDKFVGKITKALGLATNRKETQIVGEEAVRIIVKRTRLGYGVNDNLGTRARLRGLTKRYIAHRRTFKRLSGATTPSRSNLTYMGQMLGSVKVIRAKDGSVTVGPTGRRDGGYTNAQIAGFNEETGRTFNRLSMNEYRQLNRFYRKEFGDLLRKQALIR